MLIPGLTDWFHASFIDAFDWVVEPNVLGMGTYALGDAMMTKPYVSGTPYINRMGDYCKSCSLDPRKSCPYLRFIGHTSNAIVAILKATSGCQCHSERFQSDHTTRNSRTKGCLSLFTVVFVPARFGDLRTSLPCESFAWT